MMEFDRGAKRLNGNAVEYARSGASGAHARELFAEPLDYICNTLSKWFKVVGHRFAFSISNSKFFCRLWIYLYQRVLSCVVLPGGCEISAIVDNKVGKGPPLALGQ